MKKFRRAQKKNQKKQQAVSVVTVDTQEHEMTPYGTRRFRTPYHQNEFVGTQGSPLEAVVLDIDGTITDWGASANNKTVEWARKHVKAGRVLLVFTARDHDYSFTSSFNQLLNLLPFAFIGPFCRPNDDPRYASEFKRELAQGFEDLGIYRIVGAADDNTYVNEMWKQWAKDHFDNPQDFDLLECNHRSYQGWRNELKPRESSARSWNWPEKVTSPKSIAPVTSFNSLPKHSKKEPMQKKWTPGFYDALTKKWVGGHWSYIEGVAALPSAVVEEYDDFDYCDDYIPSRKDVIKIIEDEGAYFSRPQLEEFSNEDLWELAGLDYHKDLLQAVMEKFGDQFSYAQVKDLPNDDLESLLERSSSEAAVFFELLTSIY